MMGTYKKPKAKVHRDFLYLNHDTVLNSLSAFEAGMVDEIIQKTTQAQEGAVEAGLKVSGLKAGGKKGKERSVQEELVRTRTWFSAFESWYRYLKEHEAVGTFDAWDETVREQLTVGDTIEFVAEIQMSPIHKVLTSYTSFASQLGKTGSPFQMKSAEVTETKRVARMMEGWMAGPEGTRSLPVYLLPKGVDQPRMVTRLDDRYIIGGLENVEGLFTVIGQVDTLLAIGEEVSVIRVLKEVPPTPLEMKTVSDGLVNFIEPAKALGVTLTEDDLAFSHPAVLLRPIAILK